VKRVNHAFRPAWWLPGAHLQTLYPHVFRRRRPPPLRRERIELDDGDFIDLDWTPDGDGPLVLLLHGLEGSVRSHYAAGLMNTLGRHRYQSVVLNFRGCSGEPNRLARSYHSGETGDLATVVQLLQRRNPQRILHVVGISLGGNVLLKWLGENPDQTQVHSAVAISVPFLLNSAALRLQHGFSRFYQAYLLRKLHASTRDKARRLTLPIDTDELRRLRTFRQFDDRVTAPLHGFRDVDEYYARCSSRAFIPHIKTPTLILHALDDPFMTADAVPAAGETGPGVQLEVSRHGGHVGFVGGRLPWKPEYWLDERVCRWLETDARSAY